METKEIKCNNTDAISDARIFYLSDIFHSYDASKMNIIGYLMTNFKLTSEESMVCGVPDLYQRDLYTSIIEQHTDIKDEIFLPSNHLTVPKQF